MKIFFTFYQKLKNAIVEKKLSSKIKKVIYLYIRGFFIFFYKKKDIKIHISKQKNFDKSDIILAERIFESYKITKSRQKNILNFYKPSSLWQSHINNDFKYLIESYEQNDLEKFLFFLQNFGNWDQNLGIENQILVKEYNKNIFLRNILCQDIFGSQLDLWKFFNRNHKFNNVNVPMYGNQIGAYVEGKFVINGSLLNNIYADILLKYLDGEDDKIIEIGAGYGKLIYHILKKKKKYTYIDFDIPETLTLASYYLSKCFPEKKIFFYGEKKFDVNVEKEFDIIFLPPWEIENLENDSVKLAINKNSLGEVEPETAHNYLKQINRTSKYFFSMNHEYFRNHFTNGKKSLVNKEYNLDGKFRELIRYPEFGHLVFDYYKSGKSLLDHDSQIFFYIYQAIKGNENK